MNELKILFICNEYPPAPYGGIGIITKTIAEELVKQNFKVAVLGYYEGLKADKVEIREGVKVYSLARRSFLIKEKIIQAILDRICLTRAMRKIEVEFMPDIVESFDWSGPLLRKPRRAKLVVRMHGAHSAHAFYEKKRASRLLYFFEKLQLKLADELVAVSKHMGNVTLKSFALSRSFTVIYNMVDCMHFHPVAGMRDEDLLLYVGRIHPRKGLEELFKAFNFIHERNHRLKLKLIGPENPPYQQHLLSLLTSSAYQAVNFQSKVPHTEIVEYYNCAALTILPSRAEAFGLTIVESMACGTLPVCANRASGPEIIQHGVTGWLVNIDEAAEFASQVINALDSRTAEMSIKAREIALERFSIQTLLHRNVNFYHEMVDVL